MREREKCFFFFEKVLLLTPYTVIGKREIGERIAQLNHSINVWRTRRIESFDFFFSTSFWAVAFHYDERSTAGQVRVHQQSSSAGDDGIADSLFDSPGARWSHRKASGQKRHEREREKLDNRQCARPLASCNAGRRRKKKGEKKLTSRGSI